VLYDVSSTWLEGATCPLAAHGYSRDGKTGEPQITYGLATDREGRPVAANAFSGNTADPNAFAETVETVVARFGLDDVVMVGDRGMITGARLTALGDREEPLDWITALRAPQIKELADSATLPLSLFDEPTLAELADPDHPGKRLIACRNPLMADERARKRTALLERTEAELDKIAQVQRGRLNEPGKIGVCAGKAVDEFKMAKHFQLHIDHGEFSYTRNETSITAEAALDGIDVIPTSVDRDRLDAAGVVEAYKELANAEADMRSIKTVDLDLRPVSHRLTERVAAHVFLCMLARYLAWHLRQAWAPLCFADEAPPERADPLAPAERFEHAHRKASRQTTDDDQPAHSSQSLPAHLATLARQQVRFTGTDIDIDKPTHPTPIQRRAFELLGTAVPHTTPST
jgi:hypothetical protein